MKIVLFLFFIMGLCNFGIAQNVKGKIVDNNGEPVVGATLFVRETAQGCVADENGEFLLNLEPGNYTCEISSLGFEKQIRQIQLGKTTYLLEVKLEPAVYMLKEVRVTNKGEDPAYYVMRNAIAKAPFHRNQVRAYRSEVYTKGTMKLDKMPRLLMLSEDARKSVKPLIGKLFLLESVAEIAFKAPADYERKVLAFSSTIPDDMDPGDALNIITASVYDPSVMGMVSPLAPGAFSYYRFRFADCYLDGGKTINKIRVEPKKKNAKLFDGWIYIAEDDWSVVSFELTLKVMGITVQIKCMYNEVKPSVYLPTSYDMNANISLMGVKAGGKYYSSVKYKEVEAVVADAKQLPVVVTKEITKTPSPERRKIEQKLEKLSEKEKLTTRDAYRMARLAQQAMEPERPDTIPALEIRTIVSKNKVTVDSMAVRRDSLYWLKMRTIPLKQDEIVSYQIKDSIRNVIDKTIDTVQKREKNETGIGEIILGNNFKIGKKVTLGFDGLIRSVPEYNFVDGFWVGQGFDLNISMKKRKQMVITPSLYYATARKTLIWDVAARFNYATIRHGKFVLKFGDISADYNPENGTLRLENTLTSLVCADNFMKFYRKQYLTFQNDIDVANGLLLKVGGKYEKRKVLDNHISYNFFKKDPKPNTPEAEGGVNMPDNTSAGFWIQAQYTPRLYYRIKNGRKEYQKTAFPTFIARYEKGIPTDATYTNSFDRFDIGVQQNIDFGIFDHFSYIISAGKFFSKEEIYFPDYKHFNTTGWILNKDMFQGGYFLADYYRLSTNKQWLSGAVNYTSAYLLLKRLPFLQRFMFDEGVHARYLWTPGMKNYTEWGYALGFKDVGQVSVFFGFEGKNYKGVGVRVGLPLDALITYRNH